ncbi:MAG: DUF1016 domain-containing protein [Deltaproteobacteria bacterium]|nr:DUF1016 domain-containing protein [Deltaproteobacteria bacterium]
MKNQLIHYSELLDKIKARIRQGQTRAVLSANAAIIHTYWDIGAMLHNQQLVRGWGTAVIPKLSKDIHNELPQVKGFSERNLNRMIAFYRAYPELHLILPHAVAKLSPVQKLPRAVAKLNRDHWDLIASVPWGHHFLLLEKIKDLSIRFWYMQKTIEQGWGRDVLSLMIKSETHKREGKVISNFSKRLPMSQSDLIQQTLKDPYIFDFMTLEEPFRERELETNLVRHLEKFLVELGQGFAFVGRQYHIDVSEHDFYLDLLFYHLRLRCFVVIDLKKGPFKPDYAGKMNFYCNVIDDYLKHEADNPTIGLILCQDREKVLAEYTLRSIKKPIGVSQYELTRALPKQLKSSLPTIEQIETELSMKRSRKKKSKN